MTSNATCVATGAAAALLVRKDTPNRRARQILLFMLARMQVCVFLCLNLSVDSVAFQIIVFCLLLLYLDAHLLMFILSFLFSS